MDLLERAEMAAESVLVFGGWVQLHAIAQELQSAGRTLSLRPGSLFGSGGGLKELYPFTPAQIREELAQALVFEVDEGERVRVAELTFEGNQTFPDDKLRGEVKTKTKSWWRKAMR